MRDPPPVTRLASWLAAAASLGGCTFDRGGAALGDGGDGGAFDPSNLDGLTLLDGAGPPIALVPGTWRLDTDLRVLLGPDGIAEVGQALTVLDGAPEILVWATEALSVDEGAILRVRGRRALVVLAADRISVDGTIDASAGCDLAETAADRERVWCGGPGGGDGGHPDEGDGMIDATGCGPGAGGDAGVSSDERGGGGGGFGTGGGDGGGADGNGTDSEGGAACGAGTLEPLEGGSGGGSAGYRGNTAHDARTSGGGGGGAVQLTARVAIDVRGVIDASGEGGAGTTQAGTVPATGVDGGGGGGAGGAILLEAPSVRIEDGAIVVANGGGGGAGVTLDRRGERGRRARARAAGGINLDLSGGGFGAIGAGDDERATDGDGPGDGGSGGGGGAGRIHVRAAVVSAATGAVICPAASQAPLSPR